MSQQIKTYDDLCKERERIKNLLIVQKQRMRDDWDELKHEFVPVKNAFGILGKMARPDKSNPLMNAGLKMASDLFLSKFVLGKAGWVARLAVPYVVRNYSSHLWAEKGRNFMTRVSNLLNKKKRQQEYYTVAPDTPVPEPFVPNVDTTVQP